MKTSAKESLGLPELKQHKPWFDKECVGCSGKRKQANYAVGTGSMPKQI